LQNKNEILNRLGLRIKQIRVQKGITQSELARLSDKERQNIYRLEKGKINPSVHFLYEISDALSIDISELFKNSTEEDF
jgi:transcriptional regulator with XRE-family HTH domain